MRLRVKLIGQGVDGDPYRVSLPTYQVVEVDPDNLLAIVDIPHADHPFGNKTPDGKRETHPEHGEIQTSLTSAAHDALHKHLDTRYRERRGEFRPECV